jgi:hypothetical protein
MEVQTGGDGRHLHFGWNGGCVPKAIAKGVDLKGDGGYVVLPPSLHFSGKRYSIDGADTKLIVSPASAPDWLRKAIAAARTNGHTNAGPAPEGAKWGQGERNNKLASEAGSMRYRGLPRKTIEAALLEINAVQCDPPLPEAEVREIAESVSRYKPNAGVKDQAPTGDEGSLIIRRVSEIEAQPIKWLWRGRIARGKITILAGNPGLGKSLVTTSVAAVLTTGGCWPVDRTQCPPGDILFLTAEDDVADTLRPRLEAAGADLQHVHIVEGVIAGYAGDGTRQDRMFSLAEDIRALGKKLDALGDVAALVIDPITAYLGNVDSHKNADVRAVLAPLTELASRHNVAIIGVSHLTKAAGPQALMRVNGSLAFVAAARAAYLVTPDGEDKARRLFLPMKNNLGPDTTGLAFRIEEATIPSGDGPVETTKVAWEFESVTITADEAMRAEAPVKEDDSAIGEAARWVHLALVEGPVPAVKIFAMAKAEGIAEKTLRRAAKTIGVVKEKPGMAGGWIWSLPPAKVAKSPEDGQDAQGRESGHLRESWPSSDVPEDGFAEEEI